MLNFNFIAEKLKLNNKKTMLKHGVLLATTIILLCVAVWTWFSTRTTTEATGLQMSMETSSDMSISLDGGATYHPGIDLLDEESQQYIGEQNKIKDRLTMQDITSDGFTFMSPAFTVAGAERIPDVTQNWSPANPNRAYISQTIYFKTNFPAEIYMGNDTRIITRSEAENAPLVSNDVNDLVNPSSYGAFSKDCIVGALRISAINSSNQHCFTMIPRSDIELVSNGNNYAVLLGNDVSANTKSHTYFTSAKQEACNDFVLTSFPAVEKVKPTSNETMIAKTILNEDGDYIGVATVNVWLEGCDAEVKRALSGGEFNIILNFVSYEIK